MDFSGKTMVNRFEQVELYSPAEYLRRIDVLREVMRKHGVSVLLFCECSEEAYDHWLTGRWFLDMMVVSRDGQVTGILWDEMDESDCLPASAAADFGRYKLQKPYVPPCDRIRVINRLPAEKLAALIAEENPTRIGLVLPDQITLSLKNALLQQIPRAEWIDVSIPVAMARAVKSPEELCAAEQARDIQAKLYEAYDQIVRVGRRTDDINMEIQYLLHEMGGSGVVNARLLNLGPQDEPAPFGGYPERPVAWGDRLYTLLESTGPGMHHVAFGRYLSMGEPSLAYAKTIADSIRIHRYAVSLMKPGTTLKKIADQVQAYAEEMGYPFRRELGWNWMHNMGAFFYAQPSLEDYTEEIPLPENIILHCHPTPYRTFPGFGPEVREETEFLNTYFLTRDGAQDIIRVPFDLRVLG